MRKRDAEKDTETSPPETFEEALAYALKCLADGSVPLPPEWLAALNREKESSSG
jgi:hypothetical protein